MDWRFPGEFQYDSRASRSGYSRNEGQDRGVMMRWGLGRSRQLQCAVETLASSADSRESWKRGRRCIIPALGFYEWHVNPDGK